MQSAYYGANISFAFFEAPIANVMFETYNANFFSIIRLTDVMGFMALNVPSSLGIANTVCNDLFVELLKKGLTSIIGVLTALGVVIAVIGIIIGGLMRATAWGSDQRIAASNKAISSAIVGLIIVLLAVYLGTAIPNWFGLQSSTCPIAPYPSPVATPAPASTANP